MSPIPVGGGPPPPAVLPAVALAAAVASATAAAAAAGGAGPAPSAQVRRRGSLSSCKREREKKSNHRWDGCYHASWPKRVILEGGGGVYNATYGICQSSCRANNAPWGLRGWIHAPTTDERRRLIYLHAGLSFVVSFSPSFS